MHRKPIKPYLFILAFLLLMMSIAPLTSEKIRGTVIATMSPLWESLSRSQASQTGESELNKLRLENQMVKNELQRLKELQQQSSFQHHAVPAKVIFRSISSWNSSLWVNVGHATNRMLKRITIAKDSPVVVGNAIVGVVDYVGEQQSRIRLITDSGLCPAVRAARGDVQKALLCDTVELLIARLEGYSGAVELTQKQALAKQLNHFVRAMKKEKAGETHYLAKGELHGSSDPLWRSNGSLLQGIGFNYDFPDEYGAARDLRSGTPVNSKVQSAGIPLLKVNDLLVTTGMDGVFPAGLHVAEVVKINPLQEGDYTYNLEARPAAGNLEELSVVYIIPPLGYDPQDQPSPIGH